MYDQEKHGESNVKYYYQKSLAWTMVLGNADEKHEEEFKTLFPEGIKDVTLVYLVYFRQYSMRKRL